MTTYMEFAKVKDGVTFAQWDSDCGQYRITWRSEAWGIPVRSGYHATVVSVTPDGRQFWSFAAARRPYKTFATAVNACQKNRRLWTRFCKLAKSPRKGRVERVRAMDAKAIIGKKAAAHKIMSVLPLWVSTTAEPSLVRLLFPLGRRPKCDSQPTSNRSTTTESPSLTPCNENASATQVDGHASNAEAPVKPGKMDSTDGRRPKKGSARTAKGQARVTKKTSKRRTSTRSRTSS